LKPGYPGVIKAAGTTVCSRSKLLVLSRVNVKVSFVVEVALANVQEKLAWLDAIRQRVQQFVNEGGDLKSADAAPLAMALFHAINDLTNEFGIQPVKPNPNTPKPVKPDITAPYN
jgi:hypothetical protein